MQLESRPGVHHSIRSDSRIRIRHGSSSSISSVRCKIYTVRTTLPASGFGVVP
jgi:hypothetical protein